MRRRINRAFALELELQRLESLAAEWLEAFAAKSPTSEIEERLERARRRSRTHERALRRLHIRELRERE